MECIDSFSGKYRFLSNFYPAVVKLSGLEYPTVEHAFQAAKTLDVGEREVIRLAISPGAAKRAGRRAKLRDDWEEVKVDVMRGLLRQKFKDRDLRRRLLATGFAALEEGNTWGDRTWGTVNGIGENKLGHLLMDIRAECRMDEL